MAYLIKVIPSFNLISNSFRTAWIWNTSEATKWRLSSTLINTETTFSRMLVTLLLKLLQLLDPQPNQPLTHPVFMEICLTLTTVSMVSLLAVLTITTKSAMLLLVAWPTTDLRLTRLLQLESFPTQLLCPLIQLAWPNNTLFSTRML